ncbi:hypothetical protein [Desulfitobacterium hafniense]|nr:hypothetical protein [Desulfitobacterium hafniense]
MKSGLGIDRKWDVDMINNSRARTADHEQLFVSVNQKKLDVFSALIAFYLVWNAYWWVFHLISPQDTIIDILALFGVIILVIPCSVILQLKIRSFMKK